MNKKFRYSILIRITVSAVLVLLTFLFGAKTSSFSQKDLVLIFLTLIFFWESHYRFFLYFSKITIHRKFIWLSSYLWIFSIFYVLIFAYLLYHFNKIEYYFYPFIFLVFFVLCIQAFHLLTGILAKYHRQNLLVIGIQQKVLEGRYHSIKSKSILHLLQNALTANKNLIINDPEKSVQQLEILTVVLRSLLQNRDKKMTYLIEEIPVVKEYVRLMEFQSEATVSLSVDEVPENQKYLIPPFVLPLVVDNMLSQLQKKGVYSISIYIENGIYLVVKMLIGDTGLLSLPEESLLNNLKQRYHLAQELLDVTTILTQTHFIVKVPLISGKKSELIE